MKGQQQDFPRVWPPRRGGRVAVLPGICDGKPHIAGHRVKVQHLIVCYERQGMSPEEIVAEYPGLTLTDVHDGLAYYYAHHAEIEADIRADERLRAKTTLNLLDDAGQLRPLADIVNDALLRAVACCEGNLTATQKGLRISRTTLYRRLWKLGFFEKQKQTTGVQTVRR